MTMRRAFAIMQLPTPMSHLITFALLLLPVPIAILLVGLGNLRRHTVRSADAASDGRYSMAPLAGRRIPFPLPKPPQIAEPAVAAAGLARTFGLKSQLEIREPAEGRSRL